MGVIKNSWIKTGSCLRTSSERFFRKFTILEESFHNNDAKVLHQGYDLKFCSSSVANKSTCHGRKIVLFSLLYEWLKHLSFRGRFTFINIECSPATWSILFLTCSGFWRNFTDNGLVHQFLCLFEVSYYASRTFLLVLKLVLLLFINILIIVCNISIILF